MVSCADSSDNSSQEAPTAKLVVRHKNNEISSGSTFDMGRVYADGDSVTYKTIVIENRGDKNLTLNGYTKLDLTGDIDTAFQFSISDLELISEIYETTNFIVPPDSTRAFRIKFKPFYLGEQSVMVSLSTDAEDFSFILTGTGVQLNKKETLDPVTMTVLSSKSCEYLSNRLNRVFTDNSGTLKRYDYYYHSIDGYLDYTYYYLYNGASYYIKMSYFYDEWGHKTRSDSYVGDPAVFNSRKVITYEDNKITGYKRYDDVLTITDEITILYDNNGNIKSHTRVYPTNPVNNETRIFTYDDYGDRTNYKVYDNTDSLTSEAVLTKNDNSVAAEVYYSGVLSYELVVSLNSNCDWKEIRLYDSSSDLQTKTSYFFNSNEYTNKMESSDYTSPSSSYSFDYQYDTRNNLVESTKYDSSDDLENWTEYIYDSFNDLQLVKKYNAGDTTPYEIELYQ